MNAWEGEGWANSGFTQISCCVCFFAMFILSLFGGGEFPTNIITQMLEGPFVFWAQLLLASVATKSTNMDVFLFWFWFELGHGLDVFAHEVILQTALGSHPEELFNSQISIGLDLQPVSCFFVPALTSNK